VEQHAAAALADAPTAAVGEGHGPRRRSGAARAGDAPQSLTQLTGRRELQGEGAVERDDRHLERHGAGEVEDGPGHAGDRDAVDRGGLVLGQPGDVTAERPADVARCRRSPGDVLACEA
jgi:hypothetical protein